MAQAGYCSECKTNVWLTADGRCPAGHGAACIANVYKAPDSQVAPTSPAVPAAPRTSATDVRWEYRVLVYKKKVLKGNVVPSEAVEEELNQLGGEGWELVSAFPTSAAASGLYGATTEIVCVVKRRLA